MKKYLVSALTVLMFGVVANAQTVISNDYGSKTSDASGNTTSVGLTEETEENRYSGLEFSYIKPEYGWGLNYNMIFKGVTLGFRMLEGEESEIIRSNSEWSILLGYIVVR